MPALKYPTAYRNSSARELSRPAHTPKENTVFRPQTSANDNPRPTAWDKIGGKPNMVGPHTPGLDLGRVLRKEVEYVRGQIRLGNNAAAMRAAYRAVRGLARGKDIRLDLALSLIEKIMGEPMDNPSTGVKPGELQIPANRYVWGVDMNGDANASASQKNYGDPYFKMNVGTIPTPAQAAGLTPPFNYEFGSQAGYGDVSLADAIQQALSYDGDAYVMAGYQQGFISRMRFMISFRKQQGLAPSVFQWPYLPQVPYNIPAPTLRSYPHPRSSARPGQKWKTNPAWREGAQSSSPMKVDNRKVKKDSKWHISIDSKSWYGRLANGISEVGDFVDAVFKAVGGNNNVPKGDRLKYIWENRDKFDPGEFVKALVENQIEDYVWGRWGRVVAKASREGGFSSGLQTGPWDSEFQYNLGDYDLQATFRE